MPNPVIETARHGRKTALGAAITFMRDVVLPFKGDECLIWPFSRYQNGYAYFRNGGEILACRYVLKRTKGEPPTPQHEAAHSCHRGHLGCVNPNHLDWKTPAQNQADRIENGTTNRGERHGNSALNEDDVRAIRVLAGIESQAAIGRRFGIGQPQVWRIIHRKEWAWLP